MASTKSLAISSAAARVHFAVDADDAAEGRDRIAGQRLLVGLEDRRAGGRAAGVGVLDDDHRRLVELLRQLPAGVQIDEVVEAQFLALQLRGAGDAQAGAVGIERGALVGIFAVAQRLRQRQVDAQRRGQARRIRRGGRIGRGRVGNLVQRVGDGRVVGRGERKGLLGQPPAGFAAQRAVVALFSSSMRAGIIGHAGHDGHVFKVLGRGTHHRRAADVDVFDQMAEGNAGLRGGLLKGVEVDHHHVDGLDAVRGDGGLVLLRCRECRAARRAPWGAGS